MAHLLPVPLWQEPDSRVRGCQPLTLPFVPWQARTVRRTDIVNELSQCGHCQMSLLFDGNTEPIVIRNSVGVKPFSAGTAFPVELIIQGGPDLPGNAKVVMHIALK